jgi:hypothetical protein
MAARYHKKQSGTSGSRVYCPLKIYQYTHRKGDEKSKNVHHHRDENMGSKNSQEAQYCRRPSASAPPRQLRAEKTTSYSYNRGCRTFYMCSLAFPGVFGQQLPFCYVFFFGGSFGPRFTQALVFVICARFAWLTVGVSFFLGSGGACIDMGRGDEPG